MRSIQLKSLLILIVFISITSSVVLAANRGQQSLSVIVEKINELKNLESLLNKKIDQLNREKKEIAKEKKQLEEKKKFIDEYVKKKKKEADDYYTSVKKQVDEYIAKKQKELENLEKQITSEKIKKLSKIYAAAKPQAAALELSQMDEDVAARILVYMQARKAGAIISKMQPRKAASIFQKYLLKKDQLKINKQ